LRLGHGFDVVLEDFGEEILELGSSEVFENLGPLGGVVVSTEIWLELARKDFECSGFSDTVCSDQTEDLTGTGGGETMEFECVGGVSVSNVGLEIGRQVENLNSLEWASGRQPILRHNLQIKDSLLHTDTTTDTQLFRDERFFIRGVDFNTELAHFDDGT